METSLENFWFLVMIPTQWRLKSAVKGLDDKLAAERFAIVNAFWRYNELDGVLDSLTILQRFLHNSINVKKERKVC